MKRSLLVIAAVLLAYLLSGFYIVKGNEKAAVRRFGKAVATAEGNVQLVGSGLHYELPWPMARIDRLNLNEVRTLTIGVAERAEAEDAGLLPASQSADQSQFLTGDKNILNLQISVQYRVSEVACYDFLFGSEAAEQRLALLVEANAAELISQSGVDFVHPLGLGMLREMLTTRTRRLAKSARLGIEVDEVTISAVYPPVRVKAYFLDVSDARADKDKYINAARAYSEQRLAAARAEARQAVDLAETYRQEIVETSRAAAESFAKIVAQLKQQERQGVQTYSQARQMALERRYNDAMQEILRKVAGKVLLNSGQQVDLTIFHDPKE